MFTSRNGRLDGDLAGLLLESLDVSIRAGVLLNQSVSLQMLVFISTTTGVLDQADVAIGIANLSHLVSVLVLYRLVQLLNRHSHNLPFVAACLHILAPGGLFLSAPYAESLFSLLNFSGMLAYCESRQAGVATLLRRDVLLLASGMLFGFAATVRSNALFSGILFAYDAIAAVAQLPRLLVSSSGLRYLTCLVLAGTCVAIGFALPQYVAYTEYCTGAVSSAHRRTWCDALPPSIYTFVQKYYWYVETLKP